MVLPTETSSLSSSADPPAADPWAMTGDPWLDGLIFARGALRNGSVVDIKVGRMVQQVAEEAHHRAQEHGLHVEVTKRSTRHSPIEVLLRFSADRPIFQNLPRFRDRRVPTDVPDPFLAGYLQAATEIVPERDVLGEPRKDAGTAIVSPWRPGTDLEDILIVLERFGIDDPVQHKNKMELSPQDYQDVDVFEALRRAAREEENALHAEHEGRSPWDEMSRRLLVEKENGRSPPIVYAVIERRTLLQQYLEEAEHLETESHFESPNIELPYDRHEVQRALYWDFITIRPGLKESGPDILLFKPEDAQVLLERYDRIIDANFPHSKEHKTLAGIARTIRIGNARRYGDSLPRDESSGFLPDPTPRQALMDVFIAQIRPQWFVPEGPNHLRLKPLDEIVRDPEDETQTTKRIAPLGPPLVDLLGTLTFSPDDPPPGKDLLHHCTRCNEKIVLSDGARCPECDGAICLDCGTRNPKPVHCASHQATTKPKRIRIPPDTRSATRTKPTLAGKVKEINVFIRESHFKSLHKRKILTGKTLTEMVDEALGGYLGEETDQE